MEQTKKRAERPTGIGQYMSVEQIEKVKAKIKYRGLKNVFIANEMGIHRANFSQILARMRKIYPDEIKVLKKILGDI